MFKIIRLINTVRYLRPTQINYRLFYYMRRKIRQCVGYTSRLSVDAKSTTLSFYSFYSSIDLYADRTFKFLNLSHKFNSEIDWNFSGFGKLWTYNLNYFEFLNQKMISPEEGLALIDDFISQIKIVKDGMEPYPISLRGINWIKFLTTHQIKKQIIDDSLYAQYEILMDNLEYHLLGNHLLENGFALLFGACYFQDEKFYTKAKEILISELKEQILEDGAHFELSPMYHQIMLFRILDCINLVDNNSWKNDNLLGLLNEKASLMLAWLNHMTFKDGNIPLLNDSARNIAPTTRELNEYANSLQLKEHCAKLGSSGYRTKQTSAYEIVVDVGNIGPDYIPGHAHSDTFNFELYCHGKPFIVDTGTSTYEKNQRRMLERSTASHNTVEFAGVDQSEVWDGFRVARRAFVIECNESENYLEAVHDGYKKRLNALHKRKFIFNEKSISITDTVKTDQKIHAIARLHFHPVIEVKKEKNKIVCNDIIIIIKNNDFIIKDYQYAEQFNRLKDAKMVEIPFFDKLEVEILI